MASNEETKKEKKPSFVRRASFIGTGQKKEESFFKKYHEVLWVGVLILLVLGLIAIAVATTVKRVAPEQIVQNIVTTFGPDAPRHPLTGEIMEKELDALPQVFGVMVENSVDAWPLSGLEGAFLVIEAPVEANIPRFLVFSHEDSAIEKLGPVRSARPYYLDWNDELEAVYAHVGGSPEALALIRDEYETIDLNQFWQSEYFYRLNGNRYAPHNVYTNSDLLTASLDELDLEEPSYTSWMFAEGESKGEKSLKVNWDDGVTYDVDWRYDADTNQYTRYQGLSIMKMTDGATIQADNIVVLATDIRVIDNEGRRSLVSTGEGDAYMAQNGEVFLVRWEKMYREDRLRFYTHDGFEITMNAGVTWIEVVDDIGKAESY